MSLFRTSIFFQIAIGTLLLSSCSTSKNFHSTYVPGFVFASSIENLNHAKGDTLKIINDVEDDTSLVYTMFPEFVLNELENEAGSRKYFFVVSHSKEDNGVQSALNQNQYIMVLKSVILTKTEAYSPTKIKVYSADNYLLRSKDAIKGRAIVKGSATFILYDKSGGFLDSLTVRDQYKFEIVKPDSVLAAKKIKNELPKAYRNLSKMIAFSYADRVVPYERPVKRNFHVRSLTSNLFEKGMEFTRKEDWKGAFDYWQSTLVNKKHMTKADRAKMHFNIGVYYERLGDYENAVDQLEQAFALEPKVAANYLEELRRIRDLQ